MAQKKIRWRQRHEPYLISQEATQGDRRVEVYRCYPGEWGIVPYFAGHRLYFRFPIEAKLHYRTAVSLAERYLRGGDPLVLFQRPAQAS